MLWNRPENSRKIDKKRLSSGGTGKSITLLEWVKLFYVNHLEQGYKMHEIDQIDVLMYLDLVNYKAEKEYWENQRKVIAMLKGL